MTVLAGDHALRWGVVGTGGVSDSFIDDLHLAEDAEVIAVASRDRDRASRYATDHAVPRGYDFTGMLADRDIEVVYIATPPATHHALARDALDAGKHVVVEKPVALHVSEVDDIVARARASGLFLMEAMWMKFSPAVRRVVDLVRGGAIGEVRSVRASFGLPFPRSGGSRWDPALGGSALFDQGIYPLTLATTILGAPTSFSVRGEVIDEVDATHFITLEAEGGRTAQLAGSMIEYVDPSASINGTDGWIAIDPPFWTSRAFTIRSGDIAHAFTQPERQVFELEGHGYVPMIRSIARSIRAGHLEHQDHSHADMVAMTSLLARLKGALQEESAA